jgi:hypothetical protein
MRKSQSHSPKKQLKKQSNKSRQRAAADTPPPVALTPVQAVEQLRALVQQVPDVASLTVQERAALKSSKRLPENVVQASITILDASGTIVGAVGQPPEEVRQLIDDSNHWEVFAGVLRSALRSVTDGNVVRRQRARAIAARVYGVAVQLAEDPSNDELKELKQHVEDVKRLKRLARGNKPASQQPPAPAPSPAPTAPLSASAPEKAEMVETVKESKS